MFSRPTKAKRSEVASSKFGRAARTESLPAPKNFFAKTFFTQRLAPLWVRTIFGQAFVRGGMIKFSKWKVPLPGGSPRRRISLALLQPTPSDSGANASVGGLVWPSGLSRRPDWIPALSGSFQSPGATGIRLGTRHSRNGIYGMSARR